MSELTITTGLRRLAAKQYAEVHADCISALKTKISDPVPYFLLGVVAFDHQNFAKALELFSKANTFNPAQAYYSAYRAMTLSTLRRSNEAFRAAEIAAENAGEDAHLQDMIGVIYSRCGFHENAIMHFKLAVKLNTKQPNYAFNLAASLQFLGNFEAAETAYKQVLSLAPDHHRAWSSIVSLKKQTSEENSITRLKNLFNAPNITTDAKLHLGHAIAKTLEDLGQHEESLAWLLRAKADKRSEFPFDRARAKALFQATRDTSEDLPRDTVVFDQDTVPIFVVGLPRTGTTLVDRILSSHSQVKSAGELNAFAEQIKKGSKTDTPFVLDAETLLAASGIDLGTAGQDYLQQTQALADGAPYMVDKMPLNFFYAALMAKAFPKVKIIVLRRGAMDSCLSNFRQLFSTQFSYYNYTFDLENTAAFYRMFDELMAHWRETLPDDRFLEVHYENIVHDQENQTRRLLSFCDLEWEEACLRFHENTAAVSTASSVQVRQPLYTGSINRWKRYGGKLDGLKAALGNLAD